ncbi:hypothetical protein AJ79_02844 [Helicocarpus griseus UAMH5409]|uniref:Patatin-like phospholipase domain-containing protein n=1 Tax=Helicocarpus griseus UAMH5409 TaxID=1447875 RepID=A0A2B7Y1J2_9EURO|nr:hypothetical protein AJ79_02844 [Helicocarpus griseus UAMH5409]
MSLMRDRPLVPIACQQQDGTSFSVSLEPRQIPELSYLRKLTSNPLFSFVWASVTRAGAVIYKLRAKPPDAKGSSAEERIQVLYAKLHDATALNEWLGIARELDELEGINEWKATFECKDYDALLVQRRLRRLEKARLSCDAGAMIYLIRTSLSRDLGGMTNKTLYRYSRIGTKKLVDQYVTTVADTLSTLLEVSRKYDFDGVESRYLLEQLLAARRSFGRTALLLSGGATFGMSHIGVVKALWETRLLPRIISGSSAGSIVAAALCVATDGEVPKILSTVRYGDFSVFTGPSDIESVFQRLTRFFKHGSLFDIAHLTRVMKTMLGEATFREAYNRTRRTLNICVSNAGIYELPKLLNYITAPDVLIWSAVVTSCCVPLIFSTSPLLAKDPITGEVTEWHDAPHRWIDGSVDHDLPMSRLSEMFNVNHFIVSQANPHVLHFIPQEEVFLTDVVERHLNSSWMRLVTGVIGEEGLHRVQLLSEFGVLTNALKKLKSVMTQTYHGDINILPQVPRDVFPGTFKNPTTEYMIQACLSGERATWPKLARIRNHCSIEVALDTAVQIMRARVMFHLDRANEPIPSVIQPGPHRTRTRARRSSSYGDETAGAWQSAGRRARQLRRSQSSASYGGFGLDGASAAVPADVFRDMTQNATSAVFNYALESEDVLSPTLFQNFQLPGPISTNEVPYSNMADWDIKGISPVLSRRSSHSPTLTTTPARSLDIATAGPSTAASPALTISSGATTRPTSPTE